MLKLPGKIILGISLSSSAWLAYAATPTAPTPPQAQVAANNNAASTSAITFAEQAGNIAGAAQACGQDISAFSKRVTEAVYRLSNNDGERMLALANYQKTLQQAQSQQTANVPIPCNQVTQDFANLPLMRSDYEQTVMPQLGPAPNTNNTQVAANTTNAPAGTTPTTATTPTAPTTVPANNQLQQNTSIGPVKPTVPPSPSAVRQSASQINTSYNNSTSSATPTTNPALTATAPPANNLNPALTNSQQQQQQQQQSAAMNSAPPPNYPTPTSNANPEGYQNPPGNMATPTTQQSVTSSSPSSLPPVPSELQQAPSQTQSNVNATPSAPTGR